MRNRSSRMLFVAAVLSLGLAIGAVHAEAAAASVWTDISPTAIAPIGERVIAPDECRVLAAEVGELATLLAKAPLESEATDESRLVIDLPLPDGGFGRFSIVETAILHPDLGARYPEIRTYAGYGIDDPTATIALDFTPAGFHAQIIAAGGTSYIDPFQRGDITHYQSYYKRDLQPTESLGKCTVIDEDGMASEIARLVAEHGFPRSGTQLRTYRAAIATTGEYTIYHGGTVPAGLAAVTTALTRVTGVYERDVSIRMQLVANNDDIIYTNPASDPYSNNDGVAMLGQNQSTLDSVIGNANYDIGHVFSTGGGGIAGLGVVCRTSFKARGVTGLPAPIGDGFYIDYVAHEMGHQYGANHTFNGNAGACSGGNRNASTAYEPGSGSTIMAYAGICGSQNLQAHSDDYFHWVSIQEIVNYSTNGSGNTCPVTTPTGVVEPIVEAGTGGFSIPINTPFSLTASSTTTGTPTYCWEESDLGPAGHPNTPSGNAPIFRSFDPVETPTRLFPKLSNLLNNTQTIGEILPSYARTLSFKCTVRDTQAGGVGVSNDGIQFSVAALGPFLVTYPNTSGLTLPGGSQQTVTWDVAGTDGTPINCASVNILLSTDGGNTWGVDLATDTPNDGSQQITLPPQEVAQARVKVEAVGNIFFDISNFNFAIEYSADVVELASTASGLALYANTPNPFNPRTAIRFQMPRAGVASLRVYDAAGRVVRTLLDGHVEAGVQGTVWDGQDDSGRPVGSGMYLYKLHANGEVLSGRMTLLK